jgi:hypothetical protein
MVPRVAAGFFFPLTKFIPGGKLLRRKKGVIIKHELNGIASEMVVLRKWLDCCSSKIYMEELV